MCIPRWLKNIDRLLGLLGLITGLIFGVWGIHLSLKANSEMVKAEALRHTVQRTTFEAAIQKVTFFDNPARSQVEFGSFAADKVRDILKATYEDINSQMENEYLASNVNCYKDWKDFRSFLVSAIQSPEVFQIMGPEHSITKNYYAKLGVMLNDCWSL